jgi:hypothetical protein
VLASEQVRQNITDAAAANGPTSVEMTAYSHFVGLPLLAYSLLPTNNLFLSI